jgi:hypothetical protein
VAIRTITCGGARCRWDPDAHFALPRVRAAWAEQCVFSGNARDDETGDFSSRPAAGDGSAGGAGARGDSVASSEGAASSSRAEKCASKVSGKCPESFRKLRKNFERRPRRAAGSFFLETRATTRRVNFRLEPRLGTARQVARTRARESAGCARAPRRPLGPRIARQKCPESVRKVSGKLERRP